MNHTHKPELVIVDADKGHRFDSSARCPHIKALLADDEIHAIWQARIDTISPDAPHSTFVQICKSCADVFFAHWAGGVVWADSTLVWCSELVLAMEEDIPKVLADRGAGLGDLTPLTPKGEEILARHKGNLN